MFWQSIGNSTEPTVRYGIHNGTAIMTVTQSVETQPDDRRHNLYKNAAFNISNGDMPPSYTEIIENDNLSLVKR